MLSLEIINITRDPLNVVECNSLLDVLFFELLIQYAMQDEAGKRANSECPDLDETTNLTEQVKYTVGDDFLDGGMIGCLLRRSLVAICDND